MNDAMRELGRRAIAAGWRWMPGAKWRVERAAPLEPIVSRCNDHYPQECPWAGALPDFSDPATLGCLDAQLAERFGCPVIVTPFGKMFRAWRMLPPDVDEFDYRLCAIRTATTLAGAKVAALEAAPKVAP